MSPIPASIMAPKRSSHASDTESVATETGTVYEEEYYHVQEKYPRIHDGVSHSICFFVT